MARKKNKPDGEELNDAGTNDLNQDDSGNTGEGQKDPGEDNSNQGGAETTSEYVGPNYKQYVLMYPNDRIDPRNMDAATIEATIKKYPRTAAWWKS